MQAKDYRVLSCEGCQTLEYAVQNLLEQGWQVNGPMQIKNGSVQGISYSHYTQAMVLPENVKSMEERGYKKITCTKCEHGGWNTVHHSRGWSQVTCSSCKGRGFTWQK